MSSYLASDSEFTARSSFTEDQAAELAIKRTDSFLMGLAASVSAEIDARLGKRYARPFADPPEIVKIWTADLLTPRAFEALGVRPSDEVQAQIIERAKNVYLALKEAADAMTGLFDLPLASDGGASGIVAPKTLATSQQSPFSWKHEQFDDVRRDPCHG